MMYLLVIYELILVFLLVLFIRNHLIYKYRVEKVAVCFLELKKSNYDIKVFSFEEINKRLKFHLKEYNELSYNQMIYDFSKWTYDDFYESKGKGL